MRGGEREGRVRRLIRKGWQCKFPGQTKGAADASVATIVKQTARSTRRRINKQTELKRRGLEGSIEKGVRFDYYDNLA